MRISLDCPDTHEGVTVYRDALPRELSNQLTQAAYALLEMSGVDVNASSTRGFRTSKTVPIEQLPGMDKVLQGFPDIAMPQGTVRINLQYPLGKQAWHQDYICEPLVVYPEGSGYLDMAHCASSIDEARAAVSDGDVVSIPINRGDVGIVHKGGDIFHRGRNGSALEKRVTIVLH